MMLYRDCMSGTPPQWNAGDASRTLGSEHVASASAGADRESPQHNECVQRAGWEEE